VVSPQHDASADDSAARLEIAGTSSSDRVLVARIRLGDEAAFEALFRTYYQPLYAFALRYVAAHGEAEEIAQDVLSAVWAARDTWEIRESVRAYLFAAVRHRSLNVLRRRRVHDSVVALHGPEPVTVPGMGRPAPTPDAALDQTEAVAALRAAIAALPRRRREVLALRWDEGMSHAEIACVMGITVRGVEQLHARALRALRSLLVLLRE
jgi:RNA polymerase sigma-70 factor (ECF subfamily)